MENSGTQMGGLVKAQTKAVLGGLPVLHYQCQGHQQLSIVSPNSGGQPLHRGEFGSIPIKLV